MMRSFSCNAFNCRILNALISPGSTVNPREIAVLRETPSPNQIRLLMKKPFGMPSRDTRLLRFPFPPEAKSTIPVQASIMASIMGVPDWV